MEGSVGILEKLELTDSGASLQFDSPSKLFFECVYESIEKKLESLLLSKSLSSSELCRGRPVLPSGFSSSKPELLLIISIGCLLNVVDINQWLSSTCILAPTM